jgi:type IV pilus assembly protein PilW
MKLHRTRLGALAARGFSLIELMVGITISLVVMLVIFNVLSLYEGRKRTSTSVNDINQGGAYGMYMLDKAVRSAGSGFTTVWAQAFGCRLNVRFNGADVLPRPAAFPAPFTAVPVGQRLAPVLIGQGQSDTGSDVLIVMAGTAGFGETPPRMRPSDALYALAGPTRSVQMRNTVGFRHGDLVLIGNPGSPCLMSQVEAPASAAPAQGIGFTITTAPSFTTSDQLPLGPTAGASYFTDSGADIQMSALVTGDAYVAPIGNISVAAAGGPPQNPPQFRMYGVGANQTLFSYDMLRVESLLAGARADTATEIVEGVVRLSAVYGVDTNDDGIQDAWQQPTGVWAAAAPGLLDGSAASQANLRRIVAVRVAMVLRTSLPERDPVTAAVLPQPLFADLGAGFSTPVNIPAGADRNFRYRIVESTIPVRNNLMPQL